MTATLETRIATMLAAPVMPEVREFAAELAGRQDALAVLFYGSNLRTGSLDGVLDFYVLLDGPPDRGIWPRVSWHERHHAGQGDGPVLRAKVATMRLATFRAAASGRLLDTTIWARFVQPSALAWSRDAASAQAVGEAIAAAAMTAARLAVSLGPEEGTADTFWRALFRATYAAELRVESAGREDSIIAANPGHFAGLLPLAIEAGGIPATISGENLRPALTDRERKATARWWSLRRRLGKPFNIVRLIRASLTFEGAARYAAWKIERHTGIAVRLTPWRERHPVLGVTAMVWQVWRERAARS